MPIWWRRFLNWQSLYPVFLDCAKCLPLTSMHNASTGTGSPEHCFQICSTPALQWVVRQAREIYRHEVRLPHSTARVPVRSHLVRVSLRVRMRPAGQVCSSVRQSSGSRWPEGFTTRQQGRWPAGCLGLIRVILFSAIWPSAP